MKKKVLIIEADKYLSDEMMEFKCFLASHGHSVFLITNVYESLDLVKHTLQVFQPDAVAFMTTYIHTRKFAPIISLLGFVTKPIELWDLNGAYMNTSIENFIPDCFSNLVTTYQFNLLDAQCGHYNLSTHTYIS